MPILPNQAPLPPWAGELDGTRKVVLVSQGTCANHDFNLLVAPTLAAFANEPDVLVVATAGGRPVEAIPGPIPNNARLASYLPFEWILPRSDVLVTNGGYGGVNQAMSFGVPLVCAGLTEDKALGIRPRLKSGLTDECGKNCLLEIFLSFAQAAERWETLPATPSPIFGGHTNYANVNGIRLFYVEVGAGSLLLVLRGRLANTSRISVQQRNTIVLEGKVDNWEERIAAENAAWSAAGVEWDEDRPHDRIGRSIVRSAQRPRLSYWRYIHRGPLR